jgi:hypothetical protein
MPRPRLNIINVLSSWEPNRDKGLAANIASLLDFAARRLPMEPISWSLVTKCVMGGKLLGSDTKLVIDMSKRSSMIRAYLGKSPEDGGYGRGLVSVRGLGIRATVDADDYANTQLRQDATRYEGARQRLVVSRSRVDTKTMKNKELKAWVDDGVTKVLAAHTDRLAKLLLPPGSEEKEES